MVVLEGANVLHRVKGGSCPGELSGVRGGGMYGSYLSNSVVNISSVV